MPKKKDPRKIGTENRTKAFSYKRATFTVVPESRSLESLLEAMWGSTADESSKRRQIIDPESNASIVTHYRTKVHGMSFYEIVIFTPGMRALAAGLDFKKPSLEIDSVPVKDDKGNELQLIDNIAYVGVSENHVILVPSAELGAPVIESHLNWLLASATKTLDNKQSVQLANRVPPAKESVIANAKKVKFTAPIMLSGEADDATGRTFIRPKGFFWEGLSKVLQGLGDNMVDVAKNLETQGLTEQTRVDMEIALKWSRPKKGQVNELMDKVATGLRHVESEVDYEINAGSSARLTRADMILKRPRQVACQKGRPVRDLLWETMSNWLNELQTSGEVA